jgi:hypothetical protein|tara:strand:- start:1603 stop:1836 length:234 start_codon:yes stop_codon:yes gene_type:complete
MILINPAHFNFYGSSIAAFLFGVSTVITVMPMVTYYGLAAPGYFQTVGYGIIIAISIAWWLVHCFSHHANKGFKEKN